MMHTLAKRVLKFSLLFVAATILTSATPESNSSSSTSFNQPSKTKVPYYIPVNMSTTFQFDGCAVTISQTLIYVLHETTFQVLAVYAVNNIHLTIDCGTHNPFLYEIRPGDLIIDVSSGTVTDVDFTSQTDDTVNNIITDIDFLNDYKNWVESEKP